jgi:predicted nucleotidyltransferase
VFYLKKYIESRSAVSVPRVDERKNRIRKMKPNIQNILAELRHRFEAIYGDRMVNMLLFGSQARGDATSESDIDVMVVLKGPVKPGDEISRTGEISAEISLKYDVVISCIFMSAERYATGRNSLIINVHREGVSV